MPEPDTIQVILKDSKYNLSIFSGNEIQSLQKKVFTKEVRGKETLFVTVLSAKMTSS